MYMDLLRGTVVQVLSFETKTGPLPETELWFWLDVMAAFDNAEDSEYYNATLLEHAPPTAFTTHLNPDFEIGHVSGWQPMASLPSVYRVELLDSSISMFTTT